jgi:uncharacterized protein YjbI with pentapeptide repeats
MAGPDTNTNAPPYPIWGFGPPSPEPDTKKLDALLASLNGSAERFQTLWFSFLGLTLYLAIAALATTHRNLLLGEAQTLPILNIKVELLPFYVIAPLLYLVFHFYLLMMLALLARTAAEFDKQLHTTLPGESERERYRAQVGNALFLQLLVGMKGERTGVNAFLMGLIALITIVLAPLATLVLMQMMFLPYHHLRITWWHRAVVVADLVLIVVMTYRCFLPRGVRKAPLVLGALSRKPRWVTAMAFCALLAVVLAPLVDWLSFRQGRWAGEPKPSSFTEWAQWMAGRQAPPLPQFSPFPQINPDYAATEYGVVFGLFPDRLKLSDESIVGEELLEKTKKEIASRGGDFFPTIKLDIRDLQGADLERADLRGVSLAGADLRGASLSDARLDGADLLSARLRGANLSRAQLEGANLFNAQLHAADLSEARLQGADLGLAQLQGARLQPDSQYGSPPQLQGANLVNAQLQGVDLSNAKLQGADLKIAQLQGADLAGAQLEGADLSLAQLQGADLSRADLSEGQLINAFVFRTNIAGANLSNSLIVEIRADQVTRPNDKPEPAPFADAEVHAWIAAATEFVAEKDKAATSSRFDRLQVRFKDDAPEVTWAGMEEASSALDPNGAHHFRRLRSFLGDLACSPDGAPYVARRLIRHLIVLGYQVAVVRDRMEEGRKTPEKCPGVAGFTEEDWRELEAIKPD